MRSWIGVAVVVALSAAVVVGNWNLVLFAGVACSSDTPREHDPTICTDELTWPLLFLALPTVTSFAGAAISARRRRFDAAVVGLVLAPVAAPVAFLLAWSVS